MHVHVYVHVYIHTSDYACTCIYTYKCMCVCVSACVYMTTIKYPKNLGYFYNLSFTSAKTFLWETNYLPEKQLV